MSWAGVHTGASIRRVLPWIGAAVTILLLASLVWRLDWPLLLDTLAGAWLAFVLAIFVVIVLVAP